MHHQSEKKLRYWHFDLCERKIRDGNDCNEHRKTETENRKQEPDQQKTIATRSRFRSYK